MHYPTFLWISAMGNGTRSYGLLVVSSTANFDPAGFMLLLRVPMSPVDSTAFLAPFELAMESHEHILLNRNSGREIDVVSDEKRLSGCQPNNKALVSRSIIVVGKQTDDGAFCRYHHTTAMMAECI